MKAISNFISDRIRNVDIFVRYGGEEFCILLPETDIDAAATLAEEIRTQIYKEVFVFKDKKMKLTVSQGVATLLDQVTNAEVLLKLADDALYKAKTTGRNKVIVMSV